VRNDFMSSGGKEPIGARGAGEAGLLRGESPLDILHALFEIIILLAHLCKCMAGPVVS